MSLKVRDAFKPFRDQKDGLTLTVGDEAIPMLLTYQQVRSAAKDWQTYSSDAPFRVPIPSEEDARSVRQLPIETDPPEHQKYRSLIEPFFRRPIQSDYVDRIDALIGDTLRQCAGRASFDVVRDFALPIQSRALTFLLGVPEAEAETWISSGTHVFRDGDDPGQKGAVLETYLLSAIRDGAGGEDGANFFVALNRMRVDDRPLDEAEMLGISNLVFAGGRDTVINAIAFVMWCFARAPETLLAAAKAPRTINLAVEEFIRALSPLTHIGRVCPAKAGAEDRVSLCWAAANYDPAVFDDPETLNLARVPNPHVGFGSGHHACLGAPQARAILRSLIRNLAEHVRALRIEREVVNSEHYQSVERPVGFEQLLAELELQGAVPSAP
ncbi:MAG: cytochrome P450 [Pseudomonadota bacterium]